MTTGDCGPLGHEGGNADWRQTYGYILDEFLRLGRAPTKAEIAKHLRIPENLVLANLRILEEREALRLDSESAAILEAYPYSAASTRHTVHLPDGAVLHCMCAIDLFYVPFLIGSDVVIESNCHYCDAAIQISVVDGAIAKANPAATVVWYSSAAYDCPLTNFFCCDDHLRLWHEGAPDEPGRQVDLLMALERGRVAAARIRSEIAAPNG